MRLSKMGLAFSLILVFLTAFALSAVGVPPAVTATVLVARLAYRVINPSMLAGGMLRFAVETEVWINDIEEELYSGNEWITRATNDSAFVNHKTVHIPRSGGAPAVEKNRDHATDGAATPGYRADTTKDYTIDEYTTVPTAVPTIEEVQVSYAKRMSVLAEHLGVINDRIALETVDGWSSALATADISRTTGASGALIAAGGASGARLKVTAADFATIATRMSEENIPAQGRVCVLPAVMFNDLFSDATLANIWANASGNRNVFERPQFMGRFMDFDIYVRDRVMIMNTISGTAKIAVTAAASTATAAAAAGIFFHPSQVRYAKGAINLYAKENDPQFYGDVMAIGVLHGAAATRATEVGVKVLAQGGTAS